jgi:hypothetical protein
MFTSRKHWLPILAAAALFGCSHQQQASGVLTGHVSIGPLVPVVREGVPEPTPAPEVYAARQVVIYRSDGRKEIARAGIDASGDYRVDLAPGNYVVDINHGGIDMASGLPAEIQIQAGQITRLDIDIDTGIR